MKKSQIKYFSIAIIIISYSIFILESCNTNSTNEGEKQTKKASKEIDIKGVVTYFFNRNYGQKPDVGAKIYFFNVDDIPSNQKKSLDSIRTVWSVCKISPNDKVYMDKAYNEARNYAVNKYPEIKSIDEYDKTGIELARLKLEEKVIGKFEEPYLLIEKEERNKAISYFSSIIQPKEFVVNGNGEFSGKVNEGEYYIIIEFSHRDAISFDVKMINENQNLGYSILESDLK